MKLGERNFMVLTLRMKHGELTGTLLRPEGFALQDTLFSNIDPTVVTRAVVRTSFRQGRLVFVVQHQTNKADQREYEMVLTSKGEASVNRAGEPDHWIFNKLQGKSNPAIATDWGPHCFYTQDTEIDNLEMKKIYAADQALRESLRDFENGEQLETMAREDAVHREATRKLLAAGQLRTGADFEEAAYIFQHGQTPDDFLLAHTLGLIATVRGSSGGVWIAAASMDRYLQAIGKPQIYGTQFRSSSGPMTQEPYNRDLISDALRGRLRVPNQAAQTEELKRLAVPGAPK